jgi:hypothetical protein
VETVEYVVNTSDITNGWGGSGCLGHFTDEGEAIAAARKMATSMNVREVVLNGFGREMGQQLIWWAGDYWPGGMSTERYVNVVKVWNPWKP